MSAIWHTLESVGETERMAEREHPNVDFVRRGFAALAAGDLDTVTNQFAPNLRCYGADAFGRPNEMQSRDERFDLLLAVDGTLR